MITLKSALQNATTFEQLQPLMTAAKCRLSFWGGHCVSVTGFRGEIPSLNLAIRIMQIVDQNPDFGMTERTFGAACADKMNSIFKKKYEQIKECSRFTYFIYILRGIGNDLISFIARRKFDYEIENTWTWIWDTKHGEGPLPYRFVFEYFTEKQHENLFHSLPSEDTKREVFQNLADKSWRVLWYRSSYDIGSAVLAPLNASLRSALRSSRRSS